MLSKLEKDDSIKAVLKKLFDRFGENNFYLTGYWDGDLCAIGIKNSKDGENLIYISTWKVQKGRYFVEVEDSRQEVILNGYENGDMCERNFEELSEIVAEYLNLQKVYEQ